MMTKKKSFCLMLVALVLGIALGVVAVLGINYGKSTGTTIGSDVDKKTSEMASCIVNHNADADSLRFIGKSICKQYNNFSSQEKIGIDLFLNALDIAIKELDSENSAWKQKGTSDGTSYDPKKDDSDQRCSEIIENIVVFSDMETLKICNLAMGIEYSQFSKEEKVGIDLIIDIMQETIIRIKT